MNINDPQLSLVQEEPSESTFSVKGKSEISPWSKEINVFSPGRGKNLPLVRIKKSEFHQERKNWSFSTGKDVKKALKKPIDSFFNRKFSPSKELCRELKNSCNLPSNPKRDLKLFRRKIKIAVDQSRTIEELLKLTKIPTVDLLKDSETSTFSRISPLKQFDPFLRNGFYKISRKFN
jgi:hypothetical protein